MSRRAEIREKRQKAQRQRRLIIILIVLGVILIIALTTIWPNIKPIGDFIVPSLHSYPTTNGVAMGNAEAPVVIEEFSDFQCSACRSFHQNTLNQIIDQYVTTGQVYLIFRNYAFMGQESLTAANGSMCAAEQNQFWNFANILFANQAGRDSGTFSNRRLVAFAEALNLDTDQFRVCLREDRYQDAIREDYLAGINSAIDSTPSFLINGKLVVGALPFSVFQEEIEGFLVEAD